MSSAIGRSSAVRSRTTRTQALRSISRGSRAASAAASSISALRAANPSGEFPYQSNQVFHASTWGSAIESTRSPLLPTISDGRRDGVGRRTASSTW